MGKSKSLFQEIIESEVLGARISKKAKEFFDKNSSTSYQLEEEVFEVTKNGIKTTARFLFNKEGYCVNHSVVCKEKE